MKSEVIHQLNQLNHDFYQKVAPFFDTSRQYAWDGWLQLTPFLKRLTEEGQLTVVDLGCGNGRFSQFLAQQVADEKLHYLGLDTNEYLLQQAKVNLEKSGFDYQLHTFDLVEALTTNTFRPALEKLLTGITGPYLIVAFGVLHHLPAAALRQHWLKELSRLMINHQPPSAIILSAWQFLTDDQQQKKIVAPALVGIKPDDLETNDYLLSWQRGVTAYRYCHYVDDAELQQLLAATSNYHSTYFSADGKSGQLNRYLVLTRTEE